MACCACAWLSPLRPAIIMAAWAAAGLGERRSDWDRRLVGSRPGPGNWTMGWAMGGTELATLLGPGLELMGGAWSCWTRLDARLVLAVVVGRPPSLICTGLRFDMTGPGGFDMTFA